MTPFWAPVGYEGPFGGGVTEAELGAGRSLPLTEVCSAPTRPAPAGFAAPRGWARPHSAPARQVKMLCYDVLMAAPGLAAHDICAQLTCAAVTP